MSEDKDEFTKLLEKADALEAELKKLDEQHSADLERIAQLEKHLAELPKR
jgi:chaperonin cofactor prefoldin